MTTKKSTAKKSTAKAARADLSTKELIAKYDCLQTHVKILTCLAAAIFILVLVLAIVWAKCDTCKVGGAKSDSSAKVEPPEKPAEETEEEQT